MGKSEKATLKLRLTFTEPLLGTLPGDKEIAKEFITSKHPEGSQDDEEVSLRDEVEKQSTFFSYNDKNEPILWDYQIKGFLKSACQAMIATDCFTKEELNKIRLTTYLYKRTIDQLVFIAPRKVLLVLPENGELSFCERPLRAETRKGERIALARSEQAPIGTKAVFKIATLNAKLPDYIVRWLDYGELSGLGQWRNSGKGRFSYEIIGK